MGIIKSKGEKHSGFINLHLSIPARIELPQFQKQQKGPFLQNFKIPDSDT